MISTILSNILDSFFFYFIEDIFSFHYLLDNIEYSFYIDLIILYVIYNSLLL